MSFDVDIDVKSSLQRELYGIRAMIYNGESQKIMPHPSGIYPLNCSDMIKKDIFTGLSTKDYKTAERYGVFKIDLLSNTSYDSFSSKEEILECLEREPDWNLLMDRNFVEKLPHIAVHFELVEKIKPSSIEDLADILALIRPGKIHLIENYMRDKKATRRVLYTKPNNGKHYFKKSHSIAYAAMIVSLMNKLNPLDIKLS